MGVIYKITNIVNKKQYIGVTSSSMAERWKQHLYKYNAPGHTYEYPLYRAMRKYGTENFYCEQIEEVDNDILSEREIYWIDFYNTYEKGYNATRGGEGHLTYSDDQLLSLWSEGLSIKDMCLVLGCERHTLSKRLSHIIPNYSEEVKTRRNSKYSLEREKTIRQLWDEGKSNHEIAQILGVERHTPKKYLILYENFSEEEWARRNHYQKIKSNSQKIRVQQFNLQGKYIQTFESLSEAARAVGDINKASNIRAAIIGKQKSAYGFRWKYEDSEVRNGL